MKLLIESFKKFLNEDINVNVDVDDRSWKNILRVVAVNGWTAGEILMPDMDPESFEQEFLLKLYEFYDEEVDPEDEDAFEEFGELYFDGYFSDGITHHIFAKALNQFEALNILKGKRELDPREEHMYKNFLFLLIKMRGAMPDLQGLPDAYRRTNDGPIPGESLEDARKRKV